jgi:short-subunit dehydrogenase
MGRALARLLAERGERLCLLGRNIDELERSVRDLEIRYEPANPIASARCDLLDSTTFGAALALADEELGGFDTVVVSAGVFAPQEVLERDAELRDRLLVTNFSQTIRFCELAREKLLARGGGTLCLFSSVAGDRPRSPVVLYGAAKAGISHYLVGLDYRYRRRGLRTVLVKPGFVRTGMTAGLSTPPFAGESEQAARDVLHAIDRGRAVVFTPGIWRLVMLAVRALPRIIMRRVSF